MTTAMSTTTPKNRSLAVIELSNGIRAETSVLSTNYSALRSGFAGYPANPQWSGTKISAWKTGQQWREALARGEMVVRKSDALLVSVTNSKVATQPKSTGAFCFLWNILLRK